MKPAPLFKNVIYTYLRIEVTVTENQHITGSSYIRVIYTNNGLTSQNRFLKGGNNNMKRVDGTKGDLQGCVELG